MSGISTAIKNAENKNVSRRVFLRVSATAAGGLLVSLHLNGPAAAQEANPHSQVNTAAAKSYPPDAFVDIRPDGTIVIQVNAGVWQAYTTAYNATR